MKSQIVLPENIAAQIEPVLAEVYEQARAECVLLADVSGQLIEMHGKTKKFDPVLVAALAAGELAAMTELSRQIGEVTSNKSFLHEGERRSVYISSVSGTFVLIVVFTADVPVGLVRLYVRRAIERLHPLAADFEDSVGNSKQLLGIEFGSALSAELDVAFGGL